MASRKLEKGSGEEDPCDLNCCFFGHIRLIFTKFIPVRSRDGHPSTGRYAKRYLSLTADNT